MTLVAGQRVRHPKFGSGTVRDVRDRRAHVMFDIINTVLRVETGELEEPGRDPYAGVSIRAPEDTRAVAASEPAPPLDSGRLAVECLRQGLPPPGRLATFTVGHADARHRVDAALDKVASSARGTTLIVRASFGQGKTHLGALAREFAIEQGLMAMHVELDGSGLSLAKTTTSAKVLSSLFASARLRDDGSGENAPGLGTVIRRAAARMRDGFPEDLRLLSQLFVHYQELNQTEEAVETLERYLSGDLNRTRASAALSWLLQKRIELPTLGMASGSTGDRRHAIAEQLVRIVALAIAGGAKGALLVIDELDHDLGAGGGVVEMLRCLASKTVSNPLVFVLLTPSEIELGMDADEVTLDPLDPTEMRQLMGRTIDTYAAAFPSPVLMHGRDALMTQLIDRYDREFAPAKWGPRFFVRSIIEACDAARQRKLSSLAQVDVR